MLTLEEIACSSLVVVSRRDLCTGRGKDLSAVAVLAFGHRDLGKGRNGVAAVDTGNKGHNTGLRTDHGVVEVVVVGSDPCFHCLDLLRC